MKRTNDNEVIKKISAKKRPIYENCSVYTIDNNLLFRCNRKKINWYLSKNLAEIIEPKGNEEIAIRLNFVAKGKSHSDTLWGTEDRANQCCVCGTTEHLNLHHVFPYVYRKWCPELIKSHTHHDILPLCTLCHSNYENHAQKLKTALVEIFDMPLENKGYIEYPENRPVIKAANALKWHSAKIPEERKEYLFKTIYNFFEARNMSAFMTREEMIDQAMVLPTLERSKDFIEHGEYVIKQILAIHNNKEEDMNGKDNNSNNNNKDSSNQYTCSCSCQKNCPCQMKESTTISSSSPVNLKEKETKNINEMEQIQVTTNTNNNDNNTNITQDNINNKQPNLNSVSSNDNNKKIQKNNCYGEQLPSPQSPSASPSLSSLSSSSSSSSLTSSLSSSPLLSEASTSFQDTPRKKKKKKERDSKKLKLKLELELRSNKNKDENEIIHYKEAELKHFSPSKEKTDDPNGSSIERDLELLDHYINKCCGDRCHCRCQRLPMPEQIMKETYKPEGFKLLPITEEALQKNGHGHGHPSKTSSTSLNPTKKYISMIPEEVYRKANLEHIQVEKDDGAPTDMTTDALNNNINSEIPSSMNNSRGGLIGEVNKVEEVKVVEEEEEEEKKQQKNAMLERFIKMWRKHFLKYTQPKFLSVSWQVSNSVYCD
ncbi:hypothetical protein H8356DRAFT_374365 [Neocallimastix lanati (nom. inval.)]|jgi:hypothetical protein|nr:hypothetical protein H8356DRAFT_374365 [Neocallimastix sp. JGI-2020a]